MGRGNRPDRAAGFSAKLFESRPHGYVLEQQKKYLQNLSNDNGLLVEVGSGLGALADVSNSYIGVEPSLSMRERAQELYPQREFIEGSAETLPLEDQSVDLLAYRLSMHLVAELDQALAEAARVLKPRGQMVIMTLDPHRFNGHWLARLFDRYAELEKQRFPTSLQLLKKAESQGLRMTYQENRADYLQMTQENIVSQIQGRTGISTLSLMSEDEIQEALTRAASLPDKVTFSLYWQDLTFVRDP